ARACHWYAAGHRLEYGQAETLVQRWKHECRGCGPQALQLGAGNPAEEAHVLAHPGASRALAQLSLVPGWISREHEQRPALGRDPRKRAYQGLQVLVRTLGGEA